MTKSNTWYVRTGERLAGPFPTHAVEHDLALGRLTPSSLVSSDRQNWVKVSEIKEFKNFLSQTADEKNTARFDEREGERRSGADTGGVKRDHRAMGKDRRRPEPADVVRRRALAKRIWQGLVRPPESQKPVWLTIAAVVIAALALSVLLQPSVTVMSSECTSAARATINWSSCRLSGTDLRRADLHAANARNVILATSDLAGANLSQADFAYADLRDTNLKLADLRNSQLLGADLRGAILVHADLRAANLQYADLRTANIDGANFQGARLGNAIWTGGQRCARESLGSCQLD